MPQLSNKPSALTASDPMYPHSFTICKVIKETEDTFTIFLKPENGDKFNFAPGQFNMLYVYGAGEIPISISGNPADKEKIVHTTRVVGVVSSGLRRLQVGDTVGVRGPFGSSWPVDKAEGKDVVLVAGGIGLAPLRPVIYHIINNREKYGKFSILYGARTPAEMLYIKELESWGGRFDSDVYVTVDRADRKWLSNVGVVTKLIKNAFFDPDNTIAMACGPEVMMRYTAMTLQKEGIADDKIYLSMERNMKCAVGLCGHCQYAGRFICKDGPVFTYKELANLFTKREL